VNERKIQIVVLYQIQKAKKESRHARKSIELLNKAVADEMSAAHQYMFFHFHCENQGYKLLSRLFMKTALEEMGHIERCAERILFLGGEVEMAASSSVQKTHDVKAMLEMARTMEQGSIRNYNLWANECSANADAGSRKVASLDHELRGLQKMRKRKLLLALSAVVMSAVVVLACILTTVYLYINFQLDVAKMRYGLTSCLRCSNPTS